MNNFIKRLLGSPKQDSEEQLRAAQNNRPVFSPEIEAEAKRLGFNSAEEMVLFNQARRKGNTVERSRAGMAVENARRSLDRGDAMAWHPKNIFQGISDVFKDANDR